MKMVGERPLNAIMDAIADVRKAKVKEAYEKATVKCKAGGAAPPRAAAPPKGQSKPGASAKAKPKAPAAPVEDEPAEAPPAKKPAPPKAPVRYPYYIAMSVVINLQTL
jgi:cytoskeleton-associated protein 5